ncbi:MAG: hypothetical protein E7556_02125 [Ruminococcaceae bacterium]|nr:hypothetical protein [Oscillospiraceae bacterium]
MFGKLLKNDLKAQWFSVSAIYFCALIAVVVCEIGANVLDDQKQVVLCGGGVCLALLVASVTTLITVAIMFKNTMFGRAGYLTLTLPVKTGSLLISKTISGLIWIFTVYALLVGSLILWLYQIKIILGDQMTDTINNLLAIFGVPTVKTISLGVIIACVLFAAIILLTVQCMYLSLTLSQIKPISSFGKFGTIVLFFVLAGGLLSLSGTVSNMFPLNVVVSDTAIRFTSSAELTETAMSYRLTGAFFNIIASIALHFPMKFLVSKKINLK